MSGYLAVDAAIRDAPTDWKRTTFKRITTQIKIPNIASDEPLLSLASTGVVSTRLEMGGLGRQAPSDETIKSYWKVRPGQIVVNPMWLVGGSVGVSDVAGAVSPAYRVYEVNSEMHERYIHHVLRIYPYMEQYRLLGRGDTTFDRSVGREDFENLPLALPPIDEQRRIADLLDDQVALLDRAIELRQRQIELQVERAALALEDVWLPLAAQTGARTGPLDVPRVKEVPCDWTVRPLATFLDRITYGFTNPMPTADEGPYLLTANDVANGSINYDSARRTTEEAYLRSITAKSRPQRGDVLLTKDGSLGRVAEADGTPCCINQSVALLQPRWDFKDGSLAELLQVRAYREALEFNAGGSTIKHLYVSRVARQKVALPPGDTRAAIISRSRSVREAHVNSASLMRRSLELIRERKNSLITAAVTGQFDVTTVRRVD